MLSLQEYQSKLLHAFHTNSNDQNKEPMERYMRNHFPFLGIKTPLRKVLLQIFLRDEGKPNKEWL
jgi:3-methyladenine DNA glycosylase AlkD